MKILLITLCLLSSIFAESVFDLFDFPSKKAFEGSLSPITEKDISGMPIKEANDIKLYKYKNFILVFSKDILTSIIKPLEIKDMKEIDSFTEGLPYKATMIVEFVQSFSNKNTINFTDKYKGRQTLSEKSFTNKSLNTESIIYLSEYYTDEKYNILITFGKEFKKQEKECINCEFLDPSKVKEDGKTIIIYSMHQKQ